MGNKVAREKWIADEFKARIEDKKKRGVKKSQYTFRMDKKYKEFLVCTPDADGLDRISSGPVIPSQLLLRGDCVSYAIPAYANVVVNRNGCGSSHYAVRKWLMSLSTLVLKRAVSSILLGVTVRGTSE